MFQMVSTAQINVTMCSADLYFLIKDIHRFMSFDRQMQGFGYM